MALRPDVAPGYVVLSCPRSSATLASTVILLIGLLLSLAVLHTVAMLHTVAHVGPRSFTWVIAAMLALPAPPLCLLFCRAAFDYLIPRKCAVSIDRTCAVHFRLTLRSAIAKQVPHNVIRLHVVRLTCERICAMKNFQGHRADIECTIVYIFVGDRPFLLAASNRPADIETIVESARRALPGIGVSRHRLGRRITSYFPFW